MAITNLTDFTTLLNTHIKNQQQLLEQLTQLDELFEYVLTSDISRVQPSALQSQLSSMQSIVQRLKGVTEDLQAGLIDNVLPKIEALQESIIV